MADITIKKTDTCMGTGKELTFEAKNLDYIHEDFLLKLFAAGGMKASEAAEQLAAGLKQVFDPAQETPGYYNMRAVQHQHVTPDILKAAINEENLDGLLHPFNEIDITLDNDRVITAVCGHVEPDWARFVFKDCYDEHVMNDEPTNKTGYYKSKGRKHVLEEIYPHLPQEWKDIIKPRTIVETIDGERVEYADPLWLPSATDVFGVSEDGYWKDIDDSFQLPIFATERDRVKECGDNGTYPYFLRSVSAAYTTNFRSVYTSGSSNSSSADYSHGFAPGFDI